MSFDGGSHYADPDTTSNPGFGGWSHVQIPYCSQDLHMGTRTNVSGETFGLYFSGHLILEEILNALDAGSPSLKDATDILLTGDSAGGIGSWPHMDWLAARYPSARVVGAPVAGMYFYSYPYQGPNHTHSFLAPFDPAGVQALHDLYQPFLNPQCRDAYASQGLSPSPCMLSNYSLPFVTTPVFVTEAQTDSVQLVDHDDVPAAFVGLPEEQAYLAQWKANMSVALSRVLSPSNP
jgi:ribosome maturation protein SDO1